MMRLNILTRTNVWIDLDLVWIKKQKETLLSNDISKKVLQAKLRTSSISCILNMQILSKEDQHHSRSKETIQREIQVAKLVMKATT